MGHWAFGKRRERESEEWREGGERTTASLPFSIPAHSCISSHVLRKNWRMEICNGKQARRIIVPGKAG
jgi:hypothetical protein